MDRAIRRCWAMRRSCQAFVPMALLVLLWLASGACGDGGEPSKQTPTVSEGSPTQQPLSAEAQTRLAFAAAAGLSSDIYVVHTDEGQLRQITDDEALDQWPRWSPDGGHLAFVSMPLEDGPSAEKAELVVVTADGAERRTVATGGNTETYSPTVEWSPDGAMIAFETVSRSDEVMAGIDSVDLNTGQAIELATGRPSFMPAWSPDGSRIAFVSYEGDPSAGEEIDLDIYVMDADGGNVRRPVKQEGMDVGPRWSPDGRHIIWWTREAAGGPHHMFMVEAEDGKVTALGTGSRPVWSPDGKHIAFLDVVDTDNVEVFVQDIDSGERINLSSDPSQDVWPTWSPTGESIAFVSKRDDDKGEIYIVDADGSNMRRLTDNDLAEMMPTWSPR
jgi:Tol biopolymer transport system component